MPICILCRWWFESDSSHLTTDLDRLIDFSCQKSLNHRNLQCRRNLLNTNHLNTPTCCRRLTNFCFELCRVPSTAFLSHPLPWNSYPEMFVLALAVEPKPSSSVVSFLSRSLGLLTRSVAGWRMNGVLHCSMVMCSERFLFRWLALQTDRQVCRRWEVQHSKLYPLRKQCRSRVFVKKILGPKKKVPRTLPFL